jgi:hypothetical protein
MPKALLTTQDRKLLLETKRVIEEMLEMQEILADKELMKSIKQSKRDLKAGRTMDLKQLKRGARFAKHNSTP